MSGISCTVLLFNEKISNKDIREILDGIGEINDLTDCSFEVRSMDQILIHVENFHELVNDSYPYELWQKIINQITQVESYIEVTSLVNSPEVSEMILKFLSKLSEKVKFKVVNLPLPSHLIELFDPMDYDNIEDDVYLLSNNVTKYMLNKNIFSHLGYN